MGQQIGGWTDVGVVLVESALRAALVKREGARTWRALASALNSGRMPSRQLSDAALVLVGGRCCSPRASYRRRGLFFILPLTRPLACGS
ncbi:MAG: FxsA family protein [Actinomycetales bacterium]|nr:FxsA family protein [Candidatus Phosphoribacter baldrii]